MRQSALKCPKAPKNALKSSEFPCETARHDPPAADGSETNSPGPWMHPILEASSAHWLSYDMWRSIPRTPGAWLNDAPGRVGSAERITSPSRLRQKPIFGYRNLRNRYRRRGEYRHIYDGHGLPSRFLEIEVQGRCTLPQLPGSVPMIPLLPRFAVPRQSGSPAAAGAPPFASVGQGQREHLQCGFVTDS
jgi:hypothetical protein